MYINLFFSSTKQKRMFSIIFVLSLTTIIHAQLYPWNQGRTAIRGSLLSNDLSALPFGSQIFISLADVSLQDTAARVLNTITLSGVSRFPIPFELSHSSINPSLRYSIQARIERNGQLLYINDQYTPISNGPINIFMKKVGPSPYPSRLTNIYRCQMPPAVGSCFSATIRQYYFNGLTQNCEHFIYGGCGGNQNRFSTREECERACSNVRRRNTYNNAKHIPIG